MCASSNGLACSTTSKLMLVDGRGAAWVLANWDARSPRLRKSFEFNVEV